VLVSTIIKLAHSLKLKVVAEGVETEEQSSLLHALGCDELQGYLLGRPAPSELFELNYLAPVSSHEYFDPRRPGGQCAQTRPAKSCRNGTTGVAAPACRRPHTISNAHNSVARFIWASL